MNGALLHDMRSLARQRPRFRIWPHLSIADAARLDGERETCASPLAAKSICKSRENSIVSDDFPSRSENGCVRHRARYKNHMWSYDFVTDRTEGGRQLQWLVVIDKYTRECLAIEVGRSFTAQDVKGVLQYLFAVRGTPEHICSDNLGNDSGPEFVSKAICSWLKEADVKTLFHRQGQSLGEAAMSNHSMARFAMSC